MLTKYRSHIIAAIGTTFALLLLFLLLWFVYMDAPLPEEDQGIEIAFGNTQDAGGTQTNYTPEVPLPSMPAAPHVAKAQPTSNELLTQQQQETLTLPQQQEEQTRRKAEQEALRRTKEEADRAEAEKRAQEKALAEQKKKEQEAIAKANALASLFGKNNNDNNGSGQTQDNGQQGNPVGQGVSGGDSWTLADRAIRGRLPKPVNEFQQDGKVVVTIRVDAQGNVIDARETGGNISNQATIRLAIEAARKAKFSESDIPIQTGTITYNFRFN